MRGKMQKSIAAVLLSVFVLVLVPTTVMANDKVLPSENQQKVEISPRLTYIVDALASVSISGTTATVDCWVEGQYGEATKAKVIAELQVKSNSSWIAYGTWVETQNDYEAYVYETKEVKKGNTYRVKATVTVWEGSASEELILFSDEITA